MNIYFIQLSDSRGDIYSGEEKVTDYFYDKKQDKYLCKIESEKFKRGFKFLYANSPEGLCYQIKNLKLKYNDRH